MVALQAVPPIVVLVNARFFMRTSHMSRVALSALLMVASYATFAYSFYYEDLMMAYVCCVLGVAASTIGEASIMGYFKAVPQELLMTFTSGQGLS